MQSNTHKRFLTLFFSDIVGYSSLMGRDQSSAIEMVEDFRRLLQEVFSNYAGHVVEFVGDAVFARFEDATAAVEASIALQKALQQYNKARGKALPLLHVRIGLHTGMATEKDGFYFGDAVNIAARLEPLAYRDGICLSQETYDLLVDRDRFEMLNLGLQPLKNIDRKVNVYFIRPAGIHLATRFHYLRRALFRQLHAYRYGVLTLFVCLICLSLVALPRMLSPTYRANYVEVEDFIAMPDTESNWGYLGAGLSATLRAQLADLQNVYVLSSDQGIEAPVILKGTVQRLGNNVRITYQLLRRQGMVQFFGGRLDGRFEDIFELQDRAVRDISRRLAEEFGLNNYAAARLTLTDDVTAYDFYLRGMDYLSKPVSQENLDEALKFFTTSLVHDAQFAQAESGICQTYWKRFTQDSDASWLDKAKAHCQSALDLDPNLVDAARVTGLLFAETGQLSEGIEVLSRLLEKQERNSQVAISLAEIYGRAGELEKAEAILKSTIASAPDDWQGYFTLGYVYLLNGHLQQAVAQYLQVIELTPRNSRAFNNLGAAYFWLGQFKQAAEAYEQSTLISPNAMSYNNAGTMAYFAGEYDLAASKFSEANRLAPEMPDYLTNLANSLRHKKADPNRVLETYENAIRLSQKLLEKNPADLTGNWNLALCYIHLGHYDKAQRAITTLSTALPTDPKTLYLQLLYHVKLGQLTRAQDSLMQLRGTGFAEELIKRDPDLSEFYRRQNSL